MARFKDDLPSQQGWLHELARAEIHPDAERLLQLGNSFDPQQLVEESTIDFLAELRESFTDFSRVFNAYSDTSSKFQDIKVYSVAQSAADFMIFRNQVKLVISNSAHGVIQIAFAQHQTGHQVISQAQDLMAQVGPFRDVFWTFQGEKVTPEQIAKFYFTEFCRVTRETKRSRPGNQMLIDQIKALLEEKGLEL